MSATEPNHEAKEASKFRFLPDSAIVLAGITGLGYALAYTYESSFCQFFGIPSYVIEPTPTIIFQAILGIFLTSIPFIQASSMIEKLFGKFSKSFRSKVLFSLLATFLALGYFGVSWSALALSLFATFMIMGSYLLVVIEKGSLPERIQAIDEKERSSNDVEDSYIQRIVATIGKAPFLFLLFGYLLSIAAASIGAMHARQQVEFYVSTTSPDTAIVRRYGDIALGVKYVESSKALTGEVSLIKLDGGSVPLVLKKKKLGPLVGNSREIFR